MNWNKLLGILRKNESIFQLFLTVASICIAFSANQINKDQKQLEEKMARPIIDLESEYDEFGRVREVSIINTGGRLESFNVEIVPFVVF